MRCALVHDWLTGMRGGEKVLEALGEIFPEADLYTMVHVPGSVSAVIERRRIVASCLNRLPGVGRYYRNLLPVMPWAAGRLKLRGYDLVVAVSHCVAHGVAVEAGTRFVCYCLTPMRYAWGMYDAYAAGRRFDPRLAMLKLLRPSLRGWDRRAAARVTEYLADCENIRARIRACYGREADVIYPPVDTEFYRPGDAMPGDYYLWAGALVPYKRLDLLLAAAPRIGREIVVIGSGPELAGARRAAPPNVRFLGWQPDAVLRRHYAGCRALLFPGEEDFGLVPLEAQACGRPVIAYGRGGARETVKDLDAVEPTGVLFPEQTPESLLDAVGRFERAAGRFEPEAIRRHAQQFSRARCRAALRARLIGG